MRPRVTVVVVVLGGLATAVVAVLGHGDVGYRNVRLHVAVDTALAIVGAAAALVALGPLVAVANGSGIGTMSMRERAARIGGNLLIESAKGDGTTVELTWR